MVTDMFRLSEEKFNQLTMQDRLIAEILNSMVGMEFYSGVRHIIEDSYPKGVYLPDFTDNDKITMEHFKTNLESCIHCMVTLFHLYRSEYGDTAELEKHLKEISKELAENQIEKYGWNKRKAKAVA